MHSPDFCGLATVLVRPQLYTNIFTTVILTENMEKLGRPTHIDNNNNGLLSIAANAG